MKQLGYLVVSVSLLVAVIAKQGPESRLPAGQVHPPAPEAASDLSNVEVVIGWTAAGSLLLSALMGSLVYLHSVREFDAWARNRPRPNGLRLGVSPRTVANQMN